MDNYIVRIYRRNLRDPERLVGVVENVERKSQQRFHTAHELLAIFIESRTEGRKEKQVERIR